MSTGHELVSRFRALASVHPYRSIFLHPSALAAAKPDAYYRFLKSNGTSAKQITTSGDFSTSTQTSPLAALGSTSDGVYDENDDHSWIENTLMSILIYTPNSTYNRACEPIFAGLRPPWGAGIGRAENKLYFGSTSFDNRYKTRTSIVEAPITPDTWNIFVGHISGSQAWTRPIGSSTWTQHTDTPTGVAWNGAARTIPTLTKQLTLRSTGHQGESIAAGLLLEDADPGMVEVVKGIWDEWS